MTAALIEHGQYVDDAGTPLVGGKVYIGLQGADPVATSPGVPIYADRELTTQIPNPQTLGTDGRTENKVWVDGEYSIQVNSVNGVVETQQFQDLDAGFGADSSPTLEVSNVVGVDSITGTTAAALSSLTGNQQFIFTTVGENTGPVSIDIDGTGLRPIFKNHTQPVLPAEFEESQIVLIAYNEDEDNYEWLNQNNKVVDFTRSDDIPSSATTNIWVPGGNTVHVTGTDNISSFGTAPSVGARRTVVFNAGLTLSHSPSLSLPNYQDYQTEFGDIATVYARTMTDFDVTISRKNGTSVVRVGLGINQNYEDVSGSRVLGSTYQNTSDSPIEVHAQWDFGAPTWTAYLNVSNDGVSWFRIGSSYHGSVNDETNPLTCTVKAGGYYRIGSNPDGTGNSPGTSLINWVELR